VKNVFVLWSGGLDSTYLIYDNLTKGHYVRGGYVELVNNKFQVYKEKNSLCKLYDIFEANFGDQFSYTELVKFDVDNKGDYLWLPQPLIWLTSSLFISGSFDEIQLAYIMNDDAISYLEDLKKIHRSYVPIAPGLPPIKFPLSKTKKEEIIERLPKQYLKEISFCESDEEIRYCGECPSCKRMKNLLNDISKYKDFFAFGVSDKSIQFEFDFGEETKHVINGFSI